VLVIIWFLTMLVCGQISWIGQFLSKRRLLTGEDGISGCVNLSGKIRGKLLLGMLSGFLYSLHLSINHLHHLHKLLLGDHTFLHKQSSEGFSMDYLGHEKFFKGDDLFRVEANCHWDGLL